MTPRMLTVVFRSKITILDKIFKIQQNVIASTICIKSLYLYGSYLLTKQMNAKCYKVNWLKIFMKFTSGMMQSMQSYGVVMNKVIYCKSHFDKISY